MIPEKAVEAVAILLHDEYDYLELFADAPGYRRERFRKAARTILEVAEPYMQAEYRAIELERTKADERRHMFRAFHAKRDSE